MGSFQNIQTNVRGMCGNRSLNTAVITREAYMKGNNCAAIHEDMLRGIYENGAGIMRV